MPGDQTKLIMQLFQHQFILVLQVLLPWVKIIEDGILKLNHVYCLRSQVVGCGWSRLFESVLMTFPRPLLTDI